MKIQIVNKSNNPLPKYETLGSVGMDLCAYTKYSIFVPSGKSILIPTGLYISIPNGYEAQIRPRSGLALRAGLTILNTPGTIDSDYRGEIQVLLYNTSNVNYEVCNGDRIAQLVISPIQKVELEEVEELDSTERGEGGFGSTGISQSEIKAIDLVDIYEDELPLDIDYEKQENF